MNSPLLAIKQAESPFFGGVDVGGTNIKIGLVDNRGRPIAKTSIVTHEERGPQDAVDRIGAVLQELMDQLHLKNGQVAAVGLGTPGPIDVPSGTVLTPGNLPHWRHFPIRDCLSDVTGKKVAYTNDGNAAAFGEYWVGSGKNYHSVVLLTLGTGIGGGIIIGDLLIEGENGLGAECGHMLIDISENSRQCSCGLDGHLEAYASAHSIVRRTEEALTIGRSSSISARMESGEPLSTLMLYQEASQGDQLSLDLILETANYIGMGIVNLMHLLDPNAVILGGAINFGGPESKVGQQFIEHVRAEVSRRTFPILRERTLVDFASLGGDAGYIGAAGMARKMTMKTSTTNNEGG